MCKAMALAWFLSAGLARAAGPTIPIVAAENFYADVARQIGGPEVAVTAILSNPEQDPHLFEATAAAARALAAARLAIRNGAGYDPWMTRLLAASPATGRVDIAVAALAPREPDANPHLWYDPRTMPALARRLAAALAAIDPGHSAQYQARLAAFLRSFRPLEEKIVAIQAQFTGTPVTATEPVFGPMADALGLAMRNRRFQIAVMNGAEPSASAIAAMETDLRKHKVKALIYNRQATGGLARQMREIAASAHVPIVGVSETEPPGATYQEWMIRQLEALQAALASAP